MTQVESPSAALIRSYDGLLMDLDGVVYAGAQALPFAVPSLLEAARLGCRIQYVTNNASRTPEGIAAQVSAFGVPCRANQIVTSAQVAADWLTENRPPDTRVLAVGGPGLHEALHDARFSVDARFNDSQQVVVQGFGPDVSWRELAQASYALRADCFWLATNLDLTVPTADGIALGNGALVAALTAATNRSPDVTTGKPEPGPFHLAARRASMARPLVVGDRLDTDIAGGVAAGHDTMLVLTGVSTAVELVGAAPSRRPRHVDEDLRGLHQTPTPLAPREHPQVGGWRARAEATGGQVKISLTGQGGWIDGVRAVAMASWWAADAGLKVLSRDAVEHALAIGSQRVES